MATATGKGTVKFVSFKDGPKPQFNGSLVLKKKVNDIAFTVSLSDATVKGYSELSDVVVTAEKNLGSGLKGNLEYNAGKKATKLTTTWVNAAKDVTLKGIWTEKDNAFKGEGTVVLDDQNKVTGTYEFATKKATAAWTVFQGSNELTTKYDFSKSNWIVSASTKQSKDTYKVELDAGSKGVTLEYGRKPFKVVGKGNLTGNGVDNLSVAATMEHVMEF